jgi:SlyX protein
MQGKIEQLEIKIAYLEQANAELSDVVYRQQQELDLLRARVLAITTKLDAAQPPTTEYKLEDEKPPHY